MNKSKWNEVFAEMAQEAINEVTSSNAEQMAYPIIEARDALMMVGYSKEEALEIIKESILRGLKK